MQYSAKKRYVIHKKSCSLGQFFFHGLFMDFHQTLALKYMLQPQIIRAQPALSERNVQERRFNNCLIFDLAFLFSRSQKNIWIALAWL
jgi:hypothetical protein